MSKLVTIYGGSGFVGRYIAREMAREGWRVRVAVRRPNEALFVKPYGVVGQVERQVMLRVIDQRWREHLYEMDYLREGIGLRAMGQKDRLTAD